MATGLFVIADGVLITDDGTWLPGVAAALERLHLRGVPVAVLGGQQAPPAHAAIVGRWLSEGPRDEFPKPGLILRAGREAKFDLPQSWIVARSALTAKAATQAGLAGCVIVGGEPLPEGDLGIVVAAAADLADAPRVMIPRGGGCWHDLPSSPG
jgi:hypothetical protein